MDAVAQRSVDYLEGLMEGFVAYDADWRMTGVYFQDISDRKRAEAALQRANEELRESSRRKDEFLATLAHELRNPLAPISNAVEILKLQGPAEPALEAARDVIGRQLWHMVRLIDDLLDVSRITNGKLELRRERVPLAAVVEQALETSRSPPGPSSRGARAGR